MRFGLKLCLAACGLLGSAPWVLAQNPGAGSGAPAGAFKTQVSFILVANAPALPPEAYIESGPKRVRVPVTANAASKSAPVAYEGPSNLVLFVAPPAGVVAPGAPVARVELPRGPQSLVLLAPGGGAPDAKGPPQYAALAVPDDWESFPAGTMRVLNFSGKRAQAKIGGQAVVAEKGPSKPAKVVGPGKPAADIPVELATMEPDGHYVAYQNPVYIRPNQRVTIIMLPRSREGGRGASIVVTRENSPVAIAPGARQGGEKR